MYLNISDFSWLKVFDLVHYPIRDLQEGVRVIGNPSVGPHAGWPTSGSSGYSFYVGSVPMVASLTVGLDSGFMSCTM